MIDLLREIWMFLRKRKKLWLLPIVIVLFILGMFVVIGQGSVAAPLIYAVF